jgi:large subunit ribosomal protein L20
MTRVKRGTTSLKRRKNLLAQVKGYKFGRSKKERQAKEAAYHAGADAFADRRKKKNVMRRLWTVRLGAATTNLGLSYSRFIEKLNKSEVILDRKVLSHIGAHYPEVFSQILEKVSIAKEN